AASRIVVVRLRPGDGKHDADRDRPRYRIRPFVRWRSGASAAAAGLSGRLPLPLPDRSGLPSRPAAAAAGQARPATVRRGRALGSLVAMRIPRDGLPATTAHADPIAGAVDHAGGRNLG